MSTRDLADFCTLTLGPTALGFGAINLLNPSSSCFNYYLSHTNTVTCTWQWKCIMTIKMDHALMPRKLHGFLNLDAFVDGIIQESEVRSGRWGWSWDWSWSGSWLSLSTTQMGGVITWPTSSTPRGGLVCLYGIMRDTLPSINFV